MNLRLLASLLLSSGLALGGAAWAIAAGWGWLAAIAIYSFGGSALLLAISLLLASIEPVRPRLRPTPEKPADDQAFA